MGSVDSQGCLHEGDPAHPYLKHFMSLIPYMLSNQTSQTNLRVCYVCEDPETFAHSHLNLDHLQLTGNDALTQSLRL